MKKLFIFVLGLMILGSCTKPKVIKEIEYITVKEDADSVQYLTQIVNLTQMNKILTENNKVLQDSITTLNDKYVKVKEDYLVDEYKLERIKYYNSIAKNGNNIKYLRGWINRVLE